MKKLILSISFLLIFIFAFSQEVWINEIMYDTPGTDTCTFVELQGIPGTSLDSFYLIGIDGGTGTEYARIDLSGYSIPADSYFVVAESTAVANYDLVDALVDFQNGPDNVILLYDSAGIQDTIDALCYGDATYIMGVGDPANDVTGPLCRYTASVNNNYLDFAYEGTATPGVANADRSLVPSIATIQTGTSSPYEGKIVGAFNAVVTAMFSNNHFFVSDGEGSYSGLEIYVDREFSSLNIGDTIQFYHGYVQEYYSLTELYASGHILTNSGDGTYPINEITISQVGEEYEGQFVRIYKVDVADDSIGYGEWLVTDGTDTLIVDDYGTYTTPLTGTPLAYIQGVITYSYGEYKLEPRDDNDIVYGYNVDGIVSLSDAPTDQSGSNIEILENTNYSAITDSSGNFAMDYFPTGTYTFIVSHTGYASDTSTITIPGDTTLSFTLNPIASTYTLSGTVILDDSTVTDYSGSIVNVAELSLYDTTDVNGDFAFDSILAGDYTLITTHDGYEADTTAITFTGTETYTITLTSIAGVEENNEESIISQFEKTTNHLSFVYNKTTDNPVEIAIFDLTGRTVYKKQINAAPGTYNININGTFRKGVYFLNIVGEENNFIKKFVIMK